MECTAETSRPAAAALSAPQLHALFDILTHHETYREIQAFKDPETIYAYGEPFAERASADVPAGAPTYATRSTTPILHMLFVKGVLSLPPAKTLPSEFWHVRVQRMVIQLGEAELSESYDQGALGTRKILATASSALLESLGRGALGGYGGPTNTAVSTDHKTTTTYDRTDAAAFAQAWDDVLHGMVHGNLVDELFAHAAATADLEQHSPAVKAAIDYVILHLAEFLHRVFVQSPNGRYLVKLADYVHQLAPYSVVRQTLRVSNAASMINGLLRVLLAKLSVGGLTNWMGLTSAADDGMNLLQRILALVMSYDSASFRRATEKIERSKEGKDSPSKAQLAAIRDYMAQPRAHHEAVRRRSRDESRSMVVCILEASNDPSVSAAPLTDAQHAQCAQYLSALLSIHDRREIVNVFCRQSPDLFTQAVRDVMAALDPIIRSIHDRIDLKEHVTDFESFIADFLTMSKSPTPPTIKDYVDWMTGNRHMLYKWLHRVAHDTPEIRDMFRGWAVETMKMFKPGGEGAEAKETEVEAQTETKSRSSRLDGGAGALNGPLTAMFAGLPVDVQKNVAGILDQHVVYLTALDAAAVKERQALLDQIFGDGAVTPAKESKESSTNNSNCTKKQNSGRFGARWQDLMDDTVIGPATKDGPLRSGREVANVMASGKAVTSGSGPGEVGNITAGSTASRWGRKADGFRNGFASARSSRPVSPERVPSKDDSMGPTGPQPPNAAPVVDAMGDAFRQFLMERF